MGLPLSPSFRRRLGWLAPVAAAVAFVAAVPAVSALASTTPGTLPPRTAAQLLVDLQGVDLPGLSGTVTETSDLGLPSLPDDLAGAGSSSLGLLTGTHTLRVWSAGADRSRVAVLDQFGETDVVRNGSDVWRWSSSAHTAQHWTLSTRTATSPGEPDRPTVPMTPQQAADRVLTALDPTTLVTAEGTTTVAGRSAYVLELRPRQTGTLVASVEIALDGATRVPLRVQVFARGATAPALSVGFSAFDPSRPAASAFVFTPPPGTDVTDGGTARPTTTGRPAMPTSARPLTVGQGWETVVVTTLATSGTGTTDGTLARLLQQLPQVSGAWGSGRLLQGTVFSAVLTSDHRLAIGAVSPEQLYSALAAR